MRSDLLVFSHLRWRFVWQRPQHLVSRIGRGRTTWFIEEPFPAEVDEPILRHEEIDGVHRVWMDVPVPPRHMTFGDPEAPGYLDALRDLIGDVADPLVWLYTPMALEMAKTFNPDLLVYDVMDDLASFKNAPEPLKLRQRQTLAGADIVFTGGRSLYNGVLKRRQENVFLFPSGVEPEHFEKARELRRSRSRPVGGWVGVIDERLDLQLVAELADALPDWDIQMVGPVVKIDEASLPQAPNLSYPGQKPYDALPEVMAGFDVALMPFALNEATRSISPTKTLEYLAAGLPVVSTPVPDVVADYETVVAIEEDGAGFARACRETLTHSTTERDAKVRPLIRLHHWDSIAQRMEGLVSETHRTRPAKPRTVERRNGAFDYMVVGAGFAGSVLAERLASEGKKVVVVEKRPHIGGNAYDHYDDSGILVHRYGPHIFHTNSQEVFEYLSGFTQWRQYEHRVLASVDGHLVPMPINLDTINELFGMNLNVHEVEAFYESLAEPVQQLKTSEDVVVSKVGRNLYEKFFRNYTRKQWGMDPSELDASVTSRVPTRTNRDGRYFTDVFQAMPLHGYTRMFENILDHPNITIVLNSDYRDVEPLVPYREMVYTGPIDEYFDYRYGKLPYRSLDFRFETRDEEWAQPAPVVNYPNEHLYTRVTEFKYLTGQRHEKTSLVYEYPRAEGDPYYPVPQPENAALYKRYKELADDLPDVHFVGRLATYKYYNMDQVVAQALAVFGRLMRRRAATEVPRPGIAEIATPGEA
jgi:UDP-galactopyranose mutase